MESLARGWGFLKQSWQMAKDDRDLIKPSIYALFAGFIVSIIFIVPMASHWVLFWRRRYIRYLYYDLHGSDFNFRTIFSILYIFCDDHLPYLWIPV